MNTGLKEDLTRPDAYGAFHPRVVELAETHISWVFLLERDVFKIKKPVELGFLDFRTLEDRKRACEAELRLNARLAPDVYRGIVPIVRRADGRLAVGGGGAPVEWAVHMRRLSDEVRADTLVARGELSSDAIDSLARRIAMFHREARADDETARFGSPPTIAANVAENFAQTRESIEQFLSAAEARELAEWQATFLVEHAELFGKRAASGRVCDGHGDLRLEHVYFEPGQPPIVVDCIEFNERFRYADVCADVAFLSMDLASSGRVDLAEQFLARYAGYADDFDLYALVDFYESYRAHVRAKIAAMLAGDPNVDHETRARAARQARKHFLLALSFERRPLVAPMLIAVGGTIASGKSTVGRRLGDRASAPVIEADRTRKGMLGVAPEERIHVDAWQGAYDSATTDRVYAEIGRRADVILASGRPAILDASFRKREHRERARAVAQARGVPFLFVECRASPDMCRARLQARARSASVSDGRAEIFDAFSASFEPVVELGEGEHVVLDTTRSLDESMNLLARRIPTWPAGLGG